MAIKSISHNQGQYSLPRRRPLGYKPLRTSAGEARVNKIRFKILKNNTLIAEWLLSCHAL